MNEEWKDIKGYEGSYQVSSNGRVRSLERLNTLGRMLNSKILKLINDKDGYQVLTLRKENKNHYCKVHRLVAATFIDKRENEDEVNHKDENKANNHVDNLEWCNHKYNNSYGTKNLRGSLNTDYKKIAIINSKPIMQFDNNRNVIRQWDSISGCARSLGYDSSTIVKACKNKIKQAYGFIWEYAIGGD